MSGQARFAAATAAALRGNPTMVGPVLHQEMLLGGRRNRLHVLRWLYAGLLVIEIIVLFLSFQSEELARAQRNFMMGGAEAYNRTSAPEVVGERFAVLFVRQQMILLLLVTPAFVAGAITDEKRSGTLSYLVLTDLEARHIVLGKIVARLAQVALVMLAGLPLFALLAGFGGIQPITMLFSVLVLILPLFGLASAALLASVWCRQTRDAVLGLYLVGMVGALVVFLVGGPLRYLDPVYCLAPAWGPPGAIDLSEMARRMTVGGIVWGLLGGACLLAAAARLLPVYIRELESVRPEQTTWYSAGREPLEDEPVHWRERNVEGLAPSQGLRRVPQWLGIAVVATLTTLSSLGILYWAKGPKTSTADVLRASMELNVRKVASLLPDASQGFWVQGLAAMFLGSLVVGIRCSGSIANEREKQTWEAVLLTPMTAKQIVRGKLWGVLGASVWYLLAYAAPAVSLSAFGGPLALFYTLLWGAVTVLAMYFIGAAALWCSVRARNSWHSLLHTLVVGYLGGLVLYMVITPAIGIVVGLLLVALLLIDMVIGTNLARLALNAGMFGDGMRRVFFVSSCVSLVVAFWLLTKLFMARAVRWIADRDRTRHWHDEPLYRRSRINEPILRPRV
jgi:ABC-type transport system involved in multi-copper enzyme maturation permease subunit